MIAILRKELRIRMRGWRSPAIVMLYLCILAVVSYAVLSSGLNTQTFSANQANTLDKQKPSAVYDRGPCGQK